MKTKILKSLTILLFAIALIACNDDNEDSIQSLDGNYNGTFTVEYPYGRVYNNVTVIFSKKNNYESSGNGNSNDYYPSGGSGTYEIGESKITFNDINIWLANFDTHLVLDGEYDYSENEDGQISFTKNNSIGFYKYELTKN